MRLVAVGLVGVLALAGCGDDGADEPSSAASGSSEERSAAEGEQRAEERPLAGADGGGFTGQDAENYDLAKVACGSFPPRKVASDLGLAVNGDTAEELGQIAERYARGYTGSNRQAAFEGCLDGLPNLP